MNFYQSLHLNIWENHAKVESIEAFISHILKRLGILKYFFTSKNNIKQSIRAVRSFLSLRRKENVPFNDIISSIKSSEIAWIKSLGKSCGKTEFQARQRICLTVMKWIFNDYLVPLIRNNFYCTETAVHKNKLFYFRQDLWRIGTLNAANELKTRLYTKLTPENASNILDARQLGFSYLRFLPKSNGLRPIVNLSRKLISGKKFSASINFQLQTSSFIMNFEKVENIF